MRKLQALVLAVASFFALSGSAFAHVTVTPGEVLTGERTTYSVNVPNEKDNPVVMVKLLIPEGLKSVTPFVKNGWEVTVEKSGEGESAVVKSITWTGGQIGTGLRDDFRFRAVNPDKDVSLEWKAYETYENGVTVAWDQPPTAEEKEGNESGPFSVTKVAAKKTDVAPTAAAAPVTKTDRSATYVAIAALAVSLFALATNSAKKPVKSKK